jgi:UDP-2,3-diacylglucosamine hydrolase
MKVVVISDIHIFGAEDPLYASLLALLREELVPGDHLVLAGDIFDFLVGNQPVLNDQYSEFFAELRRLGNQGVRTTYIEGNHDFHLAKVFAEIPNLRLVPAETTIDLPGKRIYVAHGDLVDREDRGYLALRAFFRSPFIRFAAFALPEPVVSWIGARSADSSRKRNPRLPESRGGEHLARTRKKFRSFAEGKFREGFDAVVLGHCHDFDGQEFVEGGRMGRYLNVGFPRVHQSFVVYDAVNGLFRKPLKRFDH